MNFNYFSENMEKNTMLLTPAEPANLYDRVHRITFTYLVQKESSSEKPKCRPICIFLGEQ